MKGEGFTRKLSSFWIGPLIAGSFLATGYEVTQRLIILKSTRQQPKIELSKAASPSTEKNVEGLQEHHSVQRFSLKVKKQPENAKLDESNEEKGIQNLLQALETDFKQPEIILKPKRSLSSSATQELSISKQQPIFGPKKFDELFQTLSEN